MKINKRIVPDWTRKILVFLFFMSAFSIFSSTGQVLIYHHSQEEFRIYAKRTLTVVLEDGMRYSGAVDSVFTDKIIITTKDNEKVNIGLQKIKTYIFRLHWWYIGPCRSLIKVTYKYDTADYRYRFEPG
jgi:hypothetical protein